MKKQDPNHAILSTTDYLIIKMPSALVKAKYVKQEGKDIYISVEHKEFGEDIIKVSTAIIKLSDIYSMIINGKEIILKHWW